MKILLGIDDSRHSREAVRTVAGMTWPKGTRVIVVSASPPIWAGAGEAVSPVAIERLLENQAAHHQALVRRAEKALRAAHLKVEARVVRADPRTALLDAAKSERVDLLVVGSHGRSGLAKILMGSVASHVVAHAPCDVLVVKLAK